MKKVLKSVAVTAVTVLLVLAGSVYAVDPLFDAPVNYMVGDGPRSVAVADFDGLDGKDLAVVNYLDDNIAILLNTSHGTFGPEVYISVGSYPTSVFSADFDGINGPDLAVTKANDHGVSILLNDGFGGFLTPVNYGTGSYPYSVFSADLDGVNGPDLAVANNAHAGYGDVSILLNNGNGTFAGSVNYLAGDGPIAVFLADLDGDTDNDLAVANQDSDDVTIRLNNGNGTFAAAVNYGVGDLPYHVFSADFDGINGPDLAVPNYATDNVSILLNDGTGTFAAAVNYGVGDAPRSVFSLDFDGDNYNDLAVPNFDSDNVSVLLNNGNGTFAAADDYLAGDGPYGVFSADLDGDLNNDLAVTNFYSNDVSILINLSPDLDRVVVINEILYRTGTLGMPSALHDHEWVELYNSSDAAVDLTGWIISNGGGLFDILLPSWSLPAGCFLTVHLTSGTDDPDFSDFDGHFYTGSPAPDSHFDNDQDECALYSSTPHQASTIVDFVSWSSQGSYTPGLAHDYAVSAGIWTTGEYFDSQGMGEADCLARFFDGYDRDTPGDWRGIPWLLYVHNQPLQPYNPIQESPRNRSFVVSPPTFEWAYFADADSCQLQVAKNWVFADTTIVIDVNGLTGTDYTPGGLPQYGPYFWRLRAYLNGSPTPWAAEWSFVYILLQDIEELDPLDAPFKWQRKDTELLCLWNQKASTRPGCAEAGDHAWDKPHPNGPPPATCPHCNTYCARASIAMVNAYYGGDLSQDRISYRMNKNQRVEPEGDLGHGEGATSAQITDALGWALNVPAASITYQSGPFTFYEMKNMIDDLHCFVAGVPGHAVVADSYTEIHFPLSGTLIQAIGVQDPALGPDFWTVFAYVADGSGIVPFAHRRNNFDAVWLQPPGGLIGEPKDDAVTDHTDIDGITDFDEGQPRALDCSWTEEDTDADEVEDKAEIRNYTFHDQADYHPGHDNDALTFPDIDLDGKRAENDCDSDDDSEFDGGEDWDGNGRNPVPWTGDVEVDETCQFDANQHRLVVSVDKAVYQIGEMVSITDNPSPTHTFRENSKYFYEVGTGVPNKVDGDDIQWSGSFFTGPGGHAFLTPVGQVLQFGNYFLYVDILSDGLYSFPDNRDPFTVFRCDPPFLPWIRVAIMPQEPAVPDQLVDVGVVVQFSDMYGWMEENLSYDFLIGYDNAALTFMGATQGQLIEDCGWEYFTYRYGADGNCGDACPSGLLRIIAIADMNDGPNHPSCTGPPDTGTHQLAEMSFLVSDNPVYQGTVLPLSFFWGDCADNNITRIDSDIMYIDQAIYDHDITLIWDESDDVLFPEGGRIPFLGAPDGCLSPGVKSAATVERLLVFFNGGIDLTCDPPPACCYRVGDANGVGGDEPTIGDISIMIDAKFIAGTCDGIISSFTEADINQSGGAEPTCDDITIGDISYLIDYLFITGSELGLPGCL